MNLPKSLIEEATARRFTPAVSWARPLWETQIEMYPDSIHLPVNFVLLQRAQWVPWFLRTPNLSPLQRTFEELEEARLKVSFLTDAAHALTMSGFFYACNKKESGNYEFMGYRYGHLPQEHVTGFLYGMPAELLKCFMEVSP